MKNINLDIIEQEDAPPDDPESGIMAKYSCNMATGEYFR
jgi:hypothetical protein